MIPYSPSPYKYSHREGERGGELTRKKFIGATLHNPGRKYQND
jgi:hypothetical protein